MVICEGWEPDVRAYIADIRSLSWQAMQVRAEERVVLGDAGHEASEGRGGQQPAAGGQAHQLNSGGQGDTSSSNCSSGQQQHADAPRRVFTAAFAELPESGMSELSAHCRGCGVEHLLHAALKLDK